MSRSFNGLLLALGVLMAGVFLSEGRPTLQVILVGVITTIVLVRVVNRFVSGRTREIIVVSFITGIVEVYHFFIQPSTDLPELSGSVTLFFGIVFITRAIMVLLVETKGPGYELIKGLLGDDTN